MLSPESQFTRFLGYEMTVNDFVNRTIAAKTIVPAKNYEKVRIASLEEIARLLSNTKIVQNLYRVAVSDEPPVYKVTPFDETMILSDPIPLVIASTNSSTAGYRHRESDPSSELGLPEKIQIGRTGANVVIVHPRHEARLRDLLKNIEVPITDLEIRVDRELFE